MKSWTASKKLLSGFSGGHVINPSYELVSSGTTGAREAVQVIFDPAIISYSELVDVFWRQFDPTDDGGSFYDRGSQYRSAIFFHGNMQKAIADRSKIILEAAKIFDRPIATEIVPYTAFYSAGEDQQQFCQRNPVRYYSYHNASGRDEYIRGIWGDLKMEKYKKPTDQELKKRLTDLQYDVTQNDGTERPFANEYWDNHRDGIYVDIASDEPLFSSLDKFESGKLGQVSLNQSIQDLSLRRLMAHWERNALRFAAKQVIPILATFLMTVRLRLTCAIV